MQINIEKLGKRCYNNIACSRKSGLARSLILSAVSEYNKYEVNRLHRAVAGAAKEVAAPILASMGYEFVDVEYVKRGTEWFLTFYIDKETGTTLDDCEAASLALEGKLDAHPDIAGRYDHLIVSSPGLDRPIKTDRDFEKKIGSELEIRLFEPLNGHTNVRGTLVSFDERNVVIQSGKEPFTVSRKNIALARLRLNMNLEGRK